MGRPAPLATPYAAGHAVRRRARRTPLATPLGVARATAGRAAAWDWWCRLRLGRALGAPEEAGHKQQHRNDLKTP